MKLTPRQKRFPEEYIIDLNATRAAERSGYSKRTSYSIGARLLKKVEIKKRIKKLMEERAERMKITQDRILEELMIIAFSDLKSYVDVDPNTGAIRAKGFEGMPRDSSRALRSIKEDRVIKEDAKGDQITVYDKVKFELWDKPKTLELIGKHLGMFVERFDVGDELKKLLIERIITDKRPKE